MDQQDYFSPVSYDPGSQRPRRSMMPLLVIVGGLVAIGIGAAIVVPGVMRGLKRQEQAQEQAAADIETVPAAGVRVGEPWEWRTLAVYDWEASEQHPRPGIAFGDFGPGGDQEVLLIDFKGATRVYRADGSSRWIKKAHWLAMAQYIAWDLDRNGVDELIPNTLFYTYQPKVKSYVRINSEQIC